MENPIFSVLTCIVTLCGLISPNSESKANIIELDDGNTYTHAYVTELLPKKSGNGIVLLDFVNVFYDGKQEYERYLKAGYPDIGFDEFESATAGGMAVFNQKKTIRTFNTTADTVYEAHCLESPYRNGGGVVRLSQQEFMAMYKKSAVSKEAWQALHQKHGDCLSQDQTLVQVSYLPNKQIKKIAFVWLP